MPPQNDRVTAQLDSEPLLGGTVRRTVLPSGLRVLTEQVPGVRSAAIGVWVGVGSRDEAPAEAGASHYLEHLLFKGTPSRSALDISAALEAVGGELNAFTSREHTCYYARVVDRDLPLAVDVVSDMVTASLLRPDDVEAERGVILEEIAMHEDDPCRPGARRLFRRRAGRRSAGPAGARHHRQHRRSFSGAPSPITTDAVTYPAPPSSQ